MHTIRRRLIWPTMLVLAALLFFPGSGYSQGGNTCAAAMASPIAVPFSSSTGTLCDLTTTNDYNLVGASCMDMLNTQGPDWLYYFCAPSTGTINITVTDMTYYCLDTNVVAPFPSLSVWQGCPGAGTCLGGTTSQATPEMGVSINVIAGQCYFILIDNYPGYCPCLDYTIGVGYEPAAPVQPACTNMSFDAGGFGGWSGTYGYSMHDGAPGSATPAYSPITFAVAAPQHTITSGAGLDPFGGFPVVAPGFGPNSARLGDGQTAGYGGATIEQTFNVTAANALLTYQYAVVIQDANSVAAAHSPEQQPYFKIEVFDCAGNPIVCGQYLVVGGPSIPGFFLAPGTADVYYRPWTPVAVDLTPYIGSCATIKFSVGDCSLGAHFAYAYLDVQCAPMAITGPNLVCPGTSTTLSAPAGAAAYAWSPGGQTTPSITVSPAVSTTYTCTITSVSDAACTTFLTYPVTVHPTVTASATSAAICAGTPATITATPSSAGGSYLWSPGGAATASITVSPASTTTYTCTYTDLNGCTDTAMGTVDVTPLPNVTVNSAAICPGDTANLIANGASTYVWSAGVTVTGPNTAQAAPAVTTTYTVTGTTGSCSDTAIATVSNGGSISVSVNSAVICEGEIATLNASGASTYTWSAGATSTGVNTADASPLTTTTYTVTGFVGTCSGTAVATVTVNTVPLTTVNSTAICAGGTAALVAGGATSYAWSAGATSTGTNTASASPAFTTTYTVTGTTSGCSSTAVATVTVNPIPVSDAGPDLFLCTGIPGSIGAAANAGDVYSWSPVTGLSSSTLANPTVTLANGGSGPIITTYTVTTTTSATGCSSTDVVSVTVDPVQTANAGAPQSICFGANVVLTGSVGGSATSGTWSGGAGIFLPDANTLNATYVPSAADTAGGSVTLTLTSSGSGSCPFASSNVTINFHPTPVVDFVVNDPDGCPVHCPSFTDLSTVTGSSTITSWSWTFGDGGTSATQNPVYCYSNSGLYDVALTVTSSNGCSASLTNIQFINVFQVPVAEFSTDPGNPTIFDGYVTLVNQSTPDVNYWFWNFGDGDTLAPATANPQHLFPTDIPYVYNVTLIVHNADGCYDTVMHPVEIGPEFTFFIPNAFTPNDDGVNDYFYGKGIGIKKYDLWIFDRWGNMIWHSDSLNEKWDGKANNGPDVAQQDVYVWKVRLTDVFDKKHNYIGSVTLVK